MLLKDISRKRTHSLHQNATPALDVSEIREILRNRFTFR